MEAEGGHLRLRGLPRTVRLLAWLMVAAGAGWAEVVAARSIAGTAPDGSATGTTHVWVYLAVYATVVAAAITLVVAAATPGARMARLTLVGVGAVAAALAAELLPATRQALVTAYTLRPLPGSEPWLLAARALLGSGLTWLGLACAVALCLLSRSRAALAATLAGGALLLPLAGRVAISQAVAVPAAPTLAILAGALAAVVVWQVIVEIRVATLAGGGLARLLTTAPLVVLVVLAVKLAWLWAGRQQALPRALGGRPEHWSAARVDGPLAWLVALLVAVTAAVLLERAQQRGLRLGERAVTRLALVAGAVLVLPSLLRLVLDLAGAIIDGLRPARPIELVPLAMALVLAGWLARTSRSRAVTAGAAVVGGVALVAASALLLRPAASGQTYWNPLSLLPGDPRWVVVARLGLAAAPAVLALAGVALGLAQLAGRARPASEGADPAPGSLEDALVNALAVASFFAAAALWTMTTAFGLVDAGLWRPPFTLVRDLLTAAAPEPVTVDFALTVTATAVVAAYLVRRRTGPPALLVAVVFGATLLVHVLPFGLRALEAAPRILLLGPPLAFAVLLLFDAGPLNRAGPDRPWRVLTVTATLAFLLALVGLGVTARRLGTAASLLPDDPYPSLLGRSGSGGVDLVRLLLLVPLLVAFSAARADQSGLVPDRARPSKLGGRARAMLGLAAVLVGIAALVTLGRARDPSCGTVRTVIDSPVEVTASAGSVRCTEAVQVMRAYYERAPSEGQGSGGFLRVGRWECISNSPAGAEATGQATSCTDGERRIVALLR